MSTLAVNRRALHDYDLLEKFEAGVVLTGPEVKSAKMGRVQIAGSFVRVDGKSEVWLLGATISPYPPAADRNSPSDRERKLLLNKREQKKLMGQKGLTIVPLKLYTVGKSNRIKIEIALARGKRQYEKRESIKKREIKREISQNLKT